MRTRSQHARNPGGAAGGRSVIVAVLLGCLFVLPTLSAVVEIKYWLWDATQLPAYRAAAEAFEDKNPDVKVRVTQISWDSYWISLTTSLISESAPDVFANTLSRYPELFRHHTLADLAPYVRRDGVSADRYVGSLFQSWTQGDAQYGLPKDWDTVAIAYNRHMLDEAGIDPEDLEDLTWNSTDGGTFGRVLAQLTIDEAGENALSPNFDATRVVRHGLLMDGRMDGFGQAQWSILAGANGFLYHDGPWSRHFYYDDPLLAETLQWLRDAEEAGIVVPASDARQLMAAGLFAAGKGALAVTGSWSVNWLQTNCRFELGFAPLPIGPTGRKSMFNGLGDTMWVGTKHPEEAWRWIRFLGSREGQMIVAEHGVVFPAIREAAERAAEVMSSRGADVSIFFQQAVTPGGTFPYPASDHGSDIMEITRIWMDRIFLEKQDVATSLKKMNDEVNALFERE